MTDRTDPAEPTDTVATGPSHHAGETEPPEASETRVGDLSMMIALENRIRALEGRETSTQGPTSQPSRQEVANPDPDTPSSSDSTSDTRSHRRKRKSRTKGIKVTPHYTLRVNSSLREWGDWSLEMERVFDSDPYTYQHGHQKINKALDYVDKPLMTLWYTY